MNKRRSKIYLSRSLFAILGVVFGLLITAQYRSIPDRVTDSIKPYTSLRDTKELLYREQGDLKKEIDVLQIDISNFQNQLQNKTLTKEEINVLNAKKSLAGLTKLNGEGVIVTINDGEKSPASEETIVHAADLRDIVNLAWGSGAEGISINGERVVAMTAIDCIVNTILVNNARLSNPFSIEIIGNQNLLVDRLNNLAYLPEIHRRANNRSIIYRVEKNFDITLPSYKGSFNSQLSTQ